MRSVEVLRALPCATLWLVGLCAHAQDDRGGVPNVEVSAYRVPMTLRETAQGVSIIDRQDIEVRKPASVVDLLQQLPGVQVDQVGSPGGVSNIYIRGSDPEQVLVLIDGVRVNDPMLSRGGSYDISSIDPALIERIEVLRGGGSAIYGADALGGVVNIVTRQRPSKPFEMSIGGGIGGDGYRSLNAHVLGGTDTVSASVGLGHLEDGKRSDGGEINLNTISAALNLRPNDRFQARVFLYGNDRDSTSFPDTSGGVRLAFLRDVERRDAQEMTAGVGLKYTATSFLSLNFQISRFAREESIDSPGVTIPSLPPFPPVPPTVSNTDFTRDSALLSATLHLPLNTEVTVGGEHIDERGDANGLMLGFIPLDFSLSRRTNSLFAEAKSTPLRGLVITLGARDDRPSGLDREFSPSAGVRYTLAATGTTFKARYAEGFRAPSFYALGDPLVGNPALLPEKSKSGELGIEQRFWSDRLMFGVTAYRNRVKNLIDFDTSIFKLVNRGSVDLHGAEAVAELRPTNDLALNASYTYLDQDIDDGAAPLRNRPRHRAALAAIYQLGEAWQFSWTTSYVGEVQDFSVPTGTVTLDAFFRTDVAVSYRWRQFTTTLAIDNLFNEKYEQFVGFTAPGMRGRLMLSAQF